VRLELHPQADAEFAAQIESYERIEAGLGLKFYKHGLDSFDWIVANPNLPRLRKNYRRVNLQVFPFYIAYSIEGDLLWVLAVARGSRRPGYWKDRLSH
jgi:hypothetical protein